MSLSGAFDTVENTSNAFQSFSQQRQQEYKLGPLSPD